MGKKTKKGSASGGGEGTKLVAQNRRARFDFFLDDRYEAGLVLQGTEVKSLRGGKGSLAEAWVKIDGNGEAWLMQAHIPEYEYGNLNNHDPTRERKLLLHARELEELHRQVSAKGMTLVPLRLYFRQGKAKLELAVGQGKNVADKRRTMAERDAKRDIDRELKRRRHA